METVIVAVVAVLIFAAGVVCGVLYYRKAVAEEQLLKDHVTNEVKNLRLHFHNTFDEFARTLGKKL